MSTNVPIISVTTESNHHHHQSNYEHHHTSTSSDSEDNSDSYSNDMNYNQNFGGGITDVEDFDSYAEVDRPRSRKSSKNTVISSKGSSNTQGDVTDVEDYNDSEADEEDDKSTAYPELKLSLREFLNHDAQEHLLTSNGIKELVEHKSGNFLQAQNLNALSDYLTDCEDYNTESEIENNCEKSVCVDLNETFVEQANVNIADTTVKSKNLEDSDNGHEDISVVSDISDMASAVSDIMEKEQHATSEDEILELSGKEEICQISCSDSDSISNLSEEDLLSSVSLPPIDVAFVCATNRPKLDKGSFKNGVSPSKDGICKNSFLEVKKHKKEEVLTDIERFDDSVAEDENVDSFDGDDDNQQPIPQAVIMAVGEDGGCVTDCEDLLYDDLSEVGTSCQESARSVDLNAIPLPQREVVMLQEDKYGDTITNVMPMDKEYQFGIYAKIKDECVTDIEEFSCDDDIESQLFATDIHSRSPSPLPNNVLVEPDVTVANEVLKTQQSKRLEIISNAESVTDVEEIYMAGTNSRRKKVKTRTPTKSKSKYLEAPKLPTKDDGGGTDIEDIDLSENELPGTHKYSNRTELNRQSYHSQSEKLTDVEDITVDDVSFVSETEVPLVDINISTFKEYEANSKNIVLTMETCSAETCSKYNNRKKSNNCQPIRKNSITMHHNQQQQQTDIEDVQLPSDAEEITNNVEPTSVDCVCHELNEMLNESCTTVHEKCSNSFNVDAEKLHIKGMLRESHTDIEYVESDESAARGSK